jgi:hypothetical protein
LINLLQDPQFDSKTACDKVTTVAETMIPLPSIIETSSLWGNYAAAIVTYHDLLSKQFKKEVEKRKPSVYLAYLAKQM